MKEFIFNVVAGHRLETLTLKFNSLTGIFSRFLNTRAILNSNAHNSNTADQLFGGGCILEYI